METSLSAKRKDLTAALDQGIQFLRQNQLPTGEFRTYLANDPAMRHCVYDSSPFATSIVTYGLRYVRVPHLQAAADEMRKRAYAFFLAEMEGVGLWRYWTSRSGKSIAPDLDDTCCISFLLREAGFTGFDNRERIVQNRSADGLFYTWLQKDVEQNDIDSVVNANVLLYLGLCPETENLCGSLVQIILADREENSYWYYTGHLSLYYAISRAYRQGAVSLEPAVKNIAVKLRRFTETCQAWADPISTALLVATWINTSGWEEELFGIAADSLLSEQNPDGSWPRIPYYVGPEPPVPHYAWFGSEELTTGLCVEAIARLLNGIK